MNEDEKRKSKKIWSSAYFATLFLLSAVIGYNIKLIAVRHVTTGFEDSKIRVAKSDYDFGQAEESLRKVQDEQAAAAAQAGDPAAGEAGGAAPEGGSCGE